MLKRNHYIIIALIAAIFLSVACSTKKNTAGSRFWQAFNTRYNVYYHGETHYKEQIKELEEKYQDDYSQRLFIHPAEAYSNPKSPQPSGSFDRTIEKMQKAIALHSIKKKPDRKAGKKNDPKYKEWLKRDEYNPFLHNAWYLLAKAQYMKGDFLGSAATFHYIARHFTWMPDLVLESQLWEVLSYCAMGWTTEADNVLAHVHIDRIEDKKLLALANLAFADYYIKDHQPERAISYLSEAVKGAKGAQKVRLNFLLGQLYESTGQNELAYQAFKRAGSSSGSTYRTKFNARIKQSAVFQGKDIKSEVRSLKAMTHYDRNKEYLDQIYYAIGNLYLTRGDTTNAIENYVLAAKKSTRNGIDKAISQLTLGGIYFAQHKYDLAQPCYAEAIPQLAEDYPNYKALKRRSDVLDELSVYSQNVTLQDSLLKLSNMTLEEQKKVIKKIIDELKKKEKEEADEARREAYLADQSAKGNTLKNNTNAPATYNINNDKSWYFYNTATKNAGKTEFNKLWGNRKLEDNWRRRNKNTFSFDEDSSADDNTPTDSLSLDNTPTDSTKVDEKAAKRAEDPHYEEYYLKQIPKTDEERQQCHNLIMEGLYNMGIILKDKLEDYDGAEYEFNELLRRYPDNEYRLDTYYNLYLLHMRNNRPLEAERYRALILEEFEDSKYGQAMQDPDYLENLKQMEVVQEQIYAQAYEDYLNNNNAAVHAAYATMMERYPLSKIMPKFMFIDALSYVTEKDYDKFKEVLKDMLQRYPETDITPTASSIVKQLNQGRKPNSVGANVRGMIWNTRLTNDSTAGADIEKALTPFKEELDKPQLFVLVYDVDSVSPNAVLYEVAKHNFSSFVVKDFDLEQMSFSNVGLLVVKGFANYAEVVHYRTVFESDESLNLPPQVHYVLISENNFNLLLNEGRSFEEYFIYLEEQNSAKVEGQVPELDESELPDGSDVEKRGKSVRQSTAKEDKKKAKQAEKEQREKAKQAEKAERERAKQAEKEQREQAKQAEKEQREQEEALKREEKQQEAQRLAEEKAEREHAKQAEKEQREQEKALKREEKQQEAQRLAEEKAERERAEKAEKAEREQAEKAEKEQREQEEAERKEAEAREKAERELAERAEQAERDNAKAQEKARKEEAKRREQERKQAEKDEKQREKDKVDERKQREQQRKDQLKQREQERKQKAKERKQREKEREKARKEEQKRKKAEAKQKEKEAKQKRKEREREAKQKRKEREEERKRRQKEREAARKANK